MKTDLGPFMPKARSEGIITKEIDGELLIYDRTRDRAHCLNETAAAIWRMCDGQTSVKDIIEQWTLTGQPDTQSSESIVWLALARLRNSHLLEEALAEKEKTFWPPAIVGLAGMSRREAVRRIGLGAGIVLPIVISMTAPTPVQAAVSCGAICKTCSTPADCCGVCSSNVPGCPPGNRCT